MEETEIVGYTIEKEMEMRALIRELQDALVTFCQECPEEDAIIPKLEEHSLKIDAAVAQLLQQKTLEDRYNSLKCVREPCQDLETDLQEGTDVMKKCQELVKVLDDVPAPLAEAEIRFNELVGKLRDAAKQKKTLEGQISRWEAKFKRSEDQRLAAEKEKKAMGDKIWKLECKVNERDVEFPKLKAEIEQLRQDYEAKDDEFGILLGTVQEKSAQIEQYRNRVAKKEAKIEKLKKDAEEKDAQIAQLKRIVEERDAQIAQLKETPEETVAGNEQLKPEETVAGIEELKPEETVAGHEQLKETPKETGPGIEELRKKAEEECSKDRDKQLLNLTDAPGQSPNGEESAQDKALAEALGDPQQEPQ